MQKERIRLKNKFTFKYDRLTGKGVVITDKGEKKIDLQRRIQTKPLLNQMPSSQHGSGDGGYGIELI